MKSFNLNQTDVKNIQQENEICYSMLDEIISNDNIKSVLKIASNKIITHILQPVLDAIHQPDIQSVADISLIPIQQSIKMMAIQNIDDEIPFGGILKGFKTAENITTDIKNIKMLFLTYKKILTHIDDIKNISDVLKVLKSIADLSFCYFEYFKDSQTSEFNKMKDMIWLTPEECDARILRSELDQKEQRARTYGINREFKNDLISSDEKIGVNSGKALFAGASMKARLEIITKQFDQAMLARLEENKLVPIIKKMQYYKIPLEKDARKPLDFYAKQYETTFEKLVKNKDNKESLSLPIVANISRSTARTLITMLDLGMFRNDNHQFDFEVAQIFANTIMTFYVWGGHHSFTEVAEIYNRLLDYVAIYDKPSLQPYMEVADIPERSLPYYHIGDYSSFFHKDFRYRIIKPLNEAIELNKKLQIVSCI